MLELSARRLVLAITAAVAAVVAAVVLFYGLTLLLFGCETR
ncbi:MAG: hypothetical protein ABR521_11960 [Gaiellaceae bacterium]